MLLGADRVTDGDLSIDSFWSALGVALVAAAATVALNVIFGTNDDDAYTLGVIQRIALVVSAWFGRAHGLIPIGLLLLLVTLPAAAIDVPVSGGIGNRHYFPVTRADLKSDYEHGIGRLVASIALHAADVESFVQLPAVGAHAAERAARPRLADGADEISFFTARLEERAVGGGQLERLRFDEATAAHEGQPDERANAGTRK